MLFIAETWSCVDKDTLTENSATVTRLFMLEATRAMGATKSVGA